MPNRIKALAAKSWYSIQAKGKSSADISIYGEIASYDVTARDFVRDLKALGAVGNIDLYLSCVGGDVWDGTVIYNNLKSHAAHINVYIEGVAASMGSLIAMAGDKVYIAENAYFMIHNPAGGAFGDYREVERTQKLLLKVRDTMVAEYSPRAGVDAVEMMAMMDDETWYVGQEAVDAGFADATTDAVEMVASLNAGQLDEYIHTPAAVKALLKSPQVPNQPSAAAGTQSKPKEALMPEATKKEPAAAAEPTAAQTAQIAATAKAAAKQEEKDRRESVTAAFDGFTTAHSALYADCLQDMDCTAEKAKDKLLAAINANAAKQEPAHSYSFQVSGGEGMKMLLAHAENAIQVRAGLADRAADNGLMGYSMFEMARRVLEMRGVSTGHMSKMDVVASAFTHTSGDFGSILANTANKAMLKGYEEAEEIFTQFTSVGTLPDFKTLNRVDLGSFPSLRAVPEGAEFKNVTMGERAESAVLATYGELFSITRQAIINDDLNAFTRIPMKMGRAAIRTVGDLVFNIFLNNPAMADGKALFHADHNNLLSASAINTASIDAGRVAMAKQKDGDATLNLRPAHLLCAVSNEGAARVALESEFEVGASTRNNTTPNSVRGIANVLSDARLEGHNGWYLMANQNMHDTIEVLYLDGNSAPVLEQQDGWNIDGTQFKVRIDAAAKAWDAKGMVKTPNS